MSFPPPRPPPKSSNKNSVQDAGKGKGKNSSSNSSRFKTSGPSTSMKAQTQPSSSSLAERQTASKSVGFSAKSTVRQNENPADRSPASLARMQARPSFPFSTKSPGPSPLSQQGKPVYSKIITSSSPSSRLEPRRISSQADDSSISTRTNVSFAHGKQVKPLLPLWQQLDLEYAERSRISKRDRSGNLLDVATRRISSNTGRRAPPPEDVVVLDISNSKVPPAYLAPGLELTTQIQSQPSSSSSESDENDDVPRYRPIAKKVGTKVPSTNHPAKKSAARKIDYVDALSSNESEPDQPSNSKGKEVAVEEDEDEAEVDQLDQDQYDPPPIARTQIEDSDPEDSDIVFLDNPPEITAPLSQVSLEAIPKEPSNKSEPAEELVRAVEALTLSVIRQQNTKRLPFLLRNLRTGFIGRCSKLYVPIYSDDQAVSLKVCYGYIGGITFEMELLDWRCPLCNLLGKMRTREILDCHLRWDHAEVYCEWDELNDMEDKDSWSLQLLIPEFLKERHHIKSEPTTEQISFKVEEETETLATSPFPSVSMSPSSVQQPFSRESTPIKVEFGQYLVPPQSPTPSSSVRSTSLSTIGKSRSLTATHRSASASSTVRRPRSPNSQYPTPPPPNNPLGPAAQYPYLPAEPDYRDGQTVFYSCRPGGPCLFDLLGTLPTKEFGVLEWEVLDREEEIYESDDVREEYKVMHALWARWIFLHRNQFIANYFKGVIAFVDEYWKMIHRAAGWEALRYWLFILLTNQFINGHEVAQILLHYEKHTGMDSWYEN